MTCQEILSGLKHSDHAVVEQACVGLFEFLQTCARQEAFRRRNLDEINSVALSAWGDIRWRLRGDKLPQHVLASDRCFKAYCRRVAANTWRRRSNLHLKEFTVDGSGSADLLKALPSKDNDHEPEFSVGRADNKQLRERFERFVKTLPKENQQLALCRSDCAPAWTPTMIVSEGKTMHYVLSSQSVKVFSESLPPIVADDGSSDQERTARELITALAQRIARTVCPELNLRQLGAGATQQDRPEMFEQDAAEALRHCFSRHLRRQVAQRLQKFMVKVAEHVFTRGVVLDILSSRQSTLDPPDTVARISRSGLNALNVDALSTLWKACSNETLSGDLLAPLEGSVFAMMNSAIQKLQSAELGPLLERAEAQVADVRASGLPIKAAVETITSNAVTDLEERAKHIEDDCRSDAVFDCVEMVRWVWEMNHLPDPWPYKYLTHLWPGGNAEAAKQRVYRLRAKFEKERARGGEVTL